MILVRLYENVEYMEDVQSVIELDLPWIQLQNKSVMLSGATGMLGSFLVDVILEKNYVEDLNCTIFALGRNEEMARERFSKFSDDPHFVFIPYDVKSPLIRDDIGDVDYILHLASNTHPVQYAVDPIGTITTNIIGLKNLLDFALVHHARRFIFASSNEVYGENRGDTELFSEDYCGYINCNTIRAAYPESKRCGESLCQAYKSQKGLDIVIARFTRSYGPTMIMSNSRALNQFIKNAVAGEDIVLKSAGMQFFSYTYMADAISGMLYVLFKGQNGEAYNIADESGDITLKDIAGILAKIIDKAVVFQAPDVTETTGYSCATKARLDGCKLRTLGWVPKYDIKTGIERTVRILKSL